MPKVSIIIPNYNNAKYLDRCLQSAINQTYVDTEIICVDDKSTDNSLQILEKYTHITDKVKLIILPENKGVSNARNIALTICTGEYVCFLDSDDYIETTFCDDLLYSLLAMKSDLACGGHIKVNSENKRLSKWLPKKDISTNPIKDIYSFTKHRNVTQKLFKTKIIKDNNITFNKDLNYMEDALFLINYLKYCKSISGVKKVLYDVQINFNSLCRSQKLKDRRKTDADKATKAITQITNKE